MASIYSIKDLEQLSGIKAHTIRIWEQRYGLLEPSRTDTNIRFYDDAELKKLLNIALLNKKGFKISKLADLDPSKINSLVLKNTQTVSVGSDYTAYINEMVVAMIDMDEARFSRIYSKALSEKDFEIVVTDLIYPFLNKVGIMWGVDQINPAQEHFVTNLIKQKFLSEIDKQKINVTKKSSFVLFLPPDELHEIGLLFTHFLLRKRGFKSFYLGQTVPYNDLIDVYKQLKPTYLFGFFISSKKTNDIEDYLFEVLMQTKSADLLISGNLEMITQAKSSKKTTLIHSVNQFVNHIERLP